MSSDLRDVLIALVSAAITAALAKAIEIFRARRLRRRAIRDFPVEGTFASSYTDEIDGIARTVRDQVTIEQQGFQFTGYSENLETGRGFRLQGRIVNDKYLAGVYSGEDYADVGSGVFFMGLDLLRRGRITGLWAGYGAESGLILSGTWNWRQLLRFQTVAALPTDTRLGTAANIINDALGSGYVTSEDLKSFASDPDATVILSISNNGQIVGSSTAKCLTADETEALSGHLIRAGVRRSNLRGNTVGLLKSSAVIPTYRGQGIGLSMVEERLKFLSSRGCLVAVVLAWDSGASDSSIGVLEAAGFRQIATLAEYWREVPGEETFECVKCGIPCTCSAIVMRRALYDFVPINRATPSTRPWRWREQP